MALPLLGLFLLAPYLTHLVCLQVGQALIYKVIHAAADSTTLSTNSSGNTAAGSGSGTTVGPGRYHHRRHCSNASSGSNGVTGGPGSHSTGDLVRTGEDPTTLAWITPWGDGGSGNGADTNGAEGPVQENANA